MGFLALVLAHLPEEVHHLACTTLSKMLDVYPKISILEVGALGWSVILTRGSALILGFLTVACGLAGAHAVRPAGDTLQAPPPNALGVDEAESERTFSEEATIDLRQFKPLLAWEHFGKTRAFYESGEPGLAARSMNSWFEAGGQNAVNGARARYLQGILYSEAAEIESALKSFQAAGEVDWLLREDALLKSALYQLQLEQPEAALASLNQLKELQSSSRAWGIRGAALDQLNRPREAIVYWKRLNEREKKSSTSLALSASLLAAASKEKKDGVGRITLAQEALVAAQSAKIGLSSKEEEAKGADALVQRALALGAKNHSLSADSQLAHFRALVKKRKFEEAGEAALLIEVPKKPRYSQTRCEYDYLLGKVLAGKREWGAAADKIGSSAKNCVGDPAMHAWLLFNAGKYSAADGRQTQAIRYYADLEALYPSNSLADDARLRAARSYKKAGIAARYLSLLSSMPEDYPQGDMTMEGVLELALFRIERDDWSGAAQVLERASALVRKRDSARGHEHSGTERYFLARCHQELHEEEKALIEFESIVREVPLSYYMLHAYSRLLEADPPRAQRALQDGLKNARSSPFEFPHRPEYDRLSFRRGMELLRVGDMEHGKNILARIGLGHGADDALLWGLALLYDQVGEAHTSHGIARGRLSDWFAHYPEGDWQRPWEIGFPRPYLSFVQKESRATGVPEWFIYGVMREESTFRPRVVSHANAYGLMQIIPATARGIGKKAKLPYSTAALKEPKHNIAIGSRVLKELARRFRKNPWLAIPGYNAGPGRPARWLRQRPNVDFDVWVEMIPYRETRRYTKRVLASRAAYAFLYYRESAQTALVLPKRLTSK